MLGGNQSRETPVKAAMISAAITSLETRELGVCREHDVALGVTVNSNDIAVVEVFSCVDELHNGVVWCVVWSNRFYWDKDSG